MPYVFNPANRIYRANDCPQPVATEAACHVAAPQLDELAASYEYQARRALSGGWPFAQIGGERMTKSELYESITSNEECELLAPLLLGCKATGERLIRDWAYLTAERHLARGMR